MATLNSPGIYVEAMATGASPIAGVSTATAGFVGVAALPNRRGAAVLITSWREFTDTYGRYSDDTPWLAPALQSFFANGGQRCYVVNVEDHNSLCSGLTALEQVDEVGIVCIPGASTYEVQSAVIAHCEAAGDRFCILDSIAGADVATVRAQKSRLGSEKGIGALYYPWIVMGVETVDSDGNPVTETKPVPPSGAVAGIYARIDGKRGVFKAPANALVNGAAALERGITQNEQALLNPEGINCILSFPGRGILVWGARTIAPPGSEWKYVNVRRFLFYLEESIDKGTRWAVFEPNGEPLWSQVEGAVSNFLYAEWRKGALRGVKPEEAFFVRCDRTTMTQDDVDNGRLVVEIGAAAVRPAEFVVFRIGQWTAGRNDTQTVRGTSEPRMQGTPFQQSVWEALKRIPKGKVTTYGDLAAYLGTNAVRAVGTAVGCNPYAPEVPCHRVVRSDGRVGSYSGEGGVRGKIALLASEGVQVRRGRVVDFAEKRYRFV
ncbi:methylated-DNA--[protein]-cysteine S-methyltransferase [Sulfurimonas sp. HSL-1656]|uniref:methylated-DNA--[protein]-cysteine S-methyltransferase n=1 Tax=Thiomicrolovo subterrani TaxID=3131934 RepID=UPI0031F887B2